MNVRVRSGDCSASVRPLRQLAGDRHKIAVKPEGLEFVAHPSAELVVTDATHQAWLGARVSERQRRVGPGSAQPHAHLVHQQAGAARW